MLCDSELHMHIRVSLFSFGAVCFQNNLSIVTCILALLPLLIILAM
uniref:Uncharacterized protein n=1 Tax=Rhizophora mucronata TaxID=61149 RepID=A0A2P2QWM9_RHIMU